MQYRKRIADELLELNLEAFGATLITGPKGCGKTTTGKQKAASVIEFQDEEKRENYLAIAENQPSLLLKGKKPILFDEWQDAPKIWGAIRKAVDDEMAVGSYILTGSTSQTVKTPHTGTLRISTLMMYPMSLFESGESNGSVSLKALFNDPDSFEGCISAMSLDDIKQAICRGGWPQSLNVATDRAKTRIVKDLYNQICNRDMSNIDGKTRNPKWVDSILSSYARNICTNADIKTVFQDVEPNTGMSESSFLDYLQALEKLFIIDDIDAWCPSIRSKTAIRASKKRNFIDPSIAVAALGISPSYFDKDFKTLGFLFESLCVRDLKVYSSASYGSLSYYRDRYGLEADAVLHLEDGRYALIEFKLGESKVEEGARHLNKIERLIAEYNEKETQCPLRLPDLKMIITGSQYGYRRQDRVFVIPIGCLKD